MKPSIRRNNLDKIVSSFDLRNEPIPVGSLSKFKIEGGSVVRRPPSSVTGIVIHQTAVEYGASAIDIKKAHGVRKLAIARRAKGIACHACSFDEFYTKAYPLDWYVHHANALNSTTLGLEIEGRFSGLVDNPSTSIREDLLTLWKGEPTKLTSTRILAARAALHYLVEEGRKMGMPITYIYAHRQSKSNRRSDPGEELWKKVVLEYGVPILGLETLPLFTIGTGRPIPCAWDLDGTGPY